MPRKILKSRKKRSKSRVKKRSRKQRVRKSFSNKGNKKNHGHTRSSSMNLEELGFKTRTERSIDLHRPCGNAGDIYDKRIKEILNDKIEHEIDYEIKRRKFKKMYDEMIDKRISDEILRCKEEKERELERKNKFWF